MRRPKKTKKRAEGTVAATRGGDLWWDYRWRYFFITVSPGRLSSSSSSSFFFRFIPSATFSSGLASPCRSLTARSSSASSALPISPYVGNVHAPARSARGGLYLNNIHELRYTRQIYCPGTRGSCERPEPTPPPRPLCVPPFLRSPVLTRFFVFSSGSPFIAWPRAINPCVPRSFSFQMNVHAMLRYGSRDLSRVYERLTENYFDCKREW